MGVSVRISNEAPGETRSKRARRPTVLSRIGRRKTAVAGGLIILLFVLTAAFAPLLAPHDHLRGRIIDRLQTPNAEYLMGTDSLGRDILSRIIYGSRISLSVAVMVVGLSLTVGSTIGLVSGMAGGRVDNLIMRGIDVLQAFPGLLLAIAIVSVLGPGLVNAMLAVAISRIPQFARVMRAVTLSAKENQYVEAAYALGANNLRVSSRHVVPNTVSPLMILATIDMGTAILVTSTLGFLGLGAVPPTPEWGAMLSAGRDMLLVAPHVVMFPGIAIAIVVLGFNLLGDGIRDALDPRMSNMGLKR